MLRSRIWVLILCWAVVPSSADAQNPACYPHWFIQSPSDGQTLSNGLNDEQTLWAVGYAKTYLNWSASVEAAKSDAYERLRRLQGVRVSGERLFEAAPGQGQAYQGESFTEKILSDTLRNVAFVDSARTKELTVVLAGWRPDGRLPRLTSGAREAVSFSENAPAWTQRMPRAENRLIAVAVAPRFYYLSSSWALAERRGRQRLALQASANFQELRRSLEGSQHTVTSLQTDVRLRNVQVRRRWMDESGCYVLIEGVAERTYTE